MREEAHKWLVYSPPERGKIKGTPEDDLADIYRGLVPYGNRERGRLDDESGALSFGQTGKYANRPLALTLALATDAE
jgi:hypothetical protein